MEDVKVRIEEIYIPAKRRGKAEAALVDSLAADILENGLQVPISVRQGNQRFVLVAGLHRLEACKALGEEEIDAIVVGSPQR